jgi:nucleoside transporter
VSDDDSGPLPVSPAQAEGEAKPEAGPALTGVGNGPGLLGTRLSAMMFLQYAVFGIWLPVLSRYLLAAPEAGGLGFTSAQVGLILGLAGSIGALTAPLIGQVADRWVSTERLMAVLIIAGGVVKWITAYQTSFQAWLWLSIAYSVVYVPTLALSNSLAFSHMKDPDRQFPVVRVWGTIGWIAVAWAFPMLWLQSDLYLTWKPPFLVGTELPDVTRRLVGCLKGAGILSAVYGLYCLTLPHTPPKREGRDPFAFIKAFRMCRLSSFAVLMGAGFVIAMVHNIYFMQTASFLSSIGIRDADIMPAMSLGQFAEIAVMAALGLMLKRFGFRWVLLIGGASYVARYLVFGSTFLPVSVIVMSQAFHGLCFACFFAAAFIYIDKLAEPDIRHSAQTVFGTVLFGLGPVAGGWLNGALARVYSDADGAVDYRRFWYTAAAVATVAVVALFVAFRDQTRKVEGPAGSASPA